MDPHFNEYLAALIGMHDVYGEPSCEGVSEFHAEAGDTPAVQSAPAAAA